LERLTSAPGFRRRFDGLSEEAKLRRVPRGFPPDHPAAEWLKLRSFTAPASIEQSVVTSPPVPRLRTARALGALAQSRARLPAGEGTAVRKVSGRAYLFVRTAFGMAAVPLGVALAAIEMQQPALARAVPIAVGVVVLISGALQFTAWKAHHLACC